MRAYSYRAKKIEDQQSRLKVYQSALMALKRLKESGFTTIGEAWASVCTKRMSQVEIDKFAKLLGDDVAGRKDAHSFDWHKKWGGKRTVVFYATDTRYSERALLTVDINEDLTVDRHYSCNSLNVGSHTIASLIEDVTRGITDLEKALTLAESVETRIQAYEKDVEQAVRQAYEKHLAEVGAIIESYSY